MLDKLGWEPILKGGKEYKESKRTALMQGQRFVFVFNATKTVTVTNLLGHRVSRPMREDFKHLWLNWWWHGGRGYRIELRAVTAERITPDQGMTAILKETARRLLHKIYNQTPSGLDELWDELARGEQLDVAVAQSRILRNGFGLLPAMGVPHEGLIHESLRTWKEAQRHRGRR